MKIIFAHASGIEFFRELTEGETWHMHPSGNGIIVAHPERPPIWCRTENNTMVQGYIRTAPQPLSEQP